MKSKKGKAVKGDRNRALQVGWRGCTARVAVLALLKGVCGARLLAAQKTTNRPGWWKGKFGLFQMLATGVGGPLLQAEGESFYGQSVCLGNMQNQYSHF